MVLLTFCHVIFLSIIFNCLFLLGQATFDLELVRVKSIFGEKDDPLFAFEGLRARKINRTLYGISGKFISKEELDDNYLISVSLKHSSRGNNQFTVSPFKVVPTETCEFMNTVYKQYLMEGLKATSNLPKEEALCDIEKKEYFIKEFLFDEEKLPETLHDGLYCFTVCFHRKEDEKVLSGIEAYIKVTKELNKV